MSSYAPPRTVDPPPIELHSCTVPTAYFGGRLPLHDLGHMARSNDCAECSERLVWRLVCAIGVTCSSNRRPVMVVGEVKISEVLSVGVNIPHVAMRACMKDSLHFTACTIMPCCRGFILLTSLVVSGHPRGSCKGECAPLGGVHMGWHWSEGCRSGSSPRSRANCRPAGPRTEGPPDPLVACPPNLRARRASLELSALCKAVLWAVSRC